jgi:HSP20 family protein
MARRDKSNGGTAVEERREQQGSQAAESRTSRSESRGTAVGPLATGGVPFFGPALTATPFTMLRRVNEDFNQLFDALLRGGTDPGTGGRAGRGALTTPGQGFAALGAWTPQIEVERRKDAMVIRADLAGVNPDDVDVTVEDGVLTISGERRQERREEREGVVHTELSYGSFMRSIPLPDGADENRLSATMRNGSLEITVPIAARERGRRVKVQHS